MEKTDQGLIIGEWYYCSYNTSLYRYGGKGDPTYYFERICTTASIDIPSRSEGGTLPRFIQENTYGALLENFSHKEVASKEAVVTRLMESGKSLEEAVEIYYSTRGPIIVINNTDINNNAMLILTLRK